MVYFAAQNRSRNEKEWIQLKIAQQKEAKKKNEEKKRRINEEFARHADKKRMESVNVFLPSKLGL